MLIAALFLSGLWGCNRDIALESGKYRCQESPHCPAGLECIDGVCVNPATQSDTMPGPADTEQDTMVDTGTQPTSSFINIPAGSFWMGSPAGCPGPDGYPGDCTSELDRIENEILHYVELTHDFELGAHEVTQGEFESLMGWNPSSFSGCGSNCPVETISWYDAVAYANQLSEDVGLQACYVLSSVSCEDGGSVGSSYMDCFDTDATSGGINSATVSLVGGVSKPQECLGYRLPTESEWEYAIRAGTTTAFYNGPIISKSCSDPNMDEIGWYCGNANGSTHAVEQKDPNGLGLYDMSGNVYEWCWDRYNDYPSGTMSSPAVDPTGGTGSYGVARGGGWYHGAADCRSALRGIGEPGNRDNYVGFRLCRSLP